ncbi:HD domain-containing protein [Kineosporia sp. R_H_3]|uniref:HD domain-containing protein n=1 Tax=Kineosporia sp. R_H_3 TaxID=1961848 RepID=UPI000B4C192A|nr:HD domain-containing protein [Kineosporia sp. R_H_3]
MSGHDLAWARRTGGRLSRREELVYLVAAARAAVGARRRRSDRDARDGAVRPDLDLAEHPPDSAFTRAAFEASRAADSSAGGAVLAHCLRTWLWADVLGRANGLRPDPELLYAACLLHDLGLTPAHRGRRGGCFAVEGGLAALDLAAAHGYPHAEALADAVVLHLDVTVPVARGVEAHLLNAGAAADLLRARAHEAGRGVRRAIEERYPADGLEAGVLGPLREQAVLRPRSRGGVLERRLGFTARVLAARAPR